MNPSKYYQAFGLLMREAPNQDHYDSGCNGICPECLTCRYHRPFWRHQTCVFEYCPYSPISLPTRRDRQPSEKER